MRAGEIAGRLLLILLGSLFALGAVEIGLRLTYDYLPYPLEALIAHVRTWGIGGAPLGPPWSDYCVGDAHLGARNLPHLDHARVQFGPARYHLDTTEFGDSHTGFRRPVGAPPWDGVVVGDSFAFCHHVEYSDCWVKLLAEQSGLALANLAVPATGSVSHARYLEEFGRALEPRLVIWQYWVNDVRDDAEHVLGGFVPCPHGHAQAQPLDLRQWLKQGSVVANLLFGAYQRLRQSAPIAGRGIYFTTTDGHELMAWPNEAGAPGSGVMQSAFRLTTGAIGSAARRTLAAHASFVLLIAPSNLQVYADELPDAALRAELRAEEWTTAQLIAFAREHEIPYLDLRPAFRAAAAEGAELYPAYDVHWNRAGNALAAREINAWLRTHPLPAGP